VLQIQYDIQVIYKSIYWGRRCRVVVEFIATYAISAYHHYSCDLESHSWRVVVDTTLCDKVCQ